MSCTKLTSNDHWKFSFDSYNALSVGRGSSGTVLEIDQNLVIKTYINNDEGKRDFSREKEIFDILQKGTPSPYIVRCIEEYDEGLVLERLESTLRSRLRQQRTPLNVRSKWTLDCCRGLQFLHQKGVIHGDIGCHNFLVGRSNLVKLCDFAGSKIVGERARICYEVRGQHPDYQSGEPTIATEIFALGSTIFEIWTSCQPYAAVSNEVVRRRFRNREFPLSDIKNPAMREVILKCWTDEYVDVSQVYDDILVRTGS